MANIGVLALQGGFHAHARAIESLGHRAIEVRTKSDLDAIDGLVLPGGESTVHLKLLARFELEETLLAFHASGRPMLATCAGLILCARAVTNPAQRSFGLLDIDVARNAWGAQLDSFEDRDDSGELPLMFIRAPRIVRVGPKVKVLARLRDEPILVREGNLVGATFHPELTGDRGVHASVFGMRLIVNAA